MKVVHICLSGAVTDGFSYQDNLLSKYHKKMGMDVTFIATRWVYNENGEIVTTDKVDYINNDSVHMIRLENKQGEKYTQKFKHLRGLYETLVREAPDIIFVHGVQFLEVPEVVKYMKLHKCVKLYADNHADYSNSGRNFLSKYILQKIIWKHMAQILKPYTERFFGVLPARVDWLTDTYGLPKEKCELLVMGADDELVEKYMDLASVQKTRIRFGLSQEDFLIVTGGKIDSFKLQTLDLMEAVKRINDAHVKLIVFGSIQKDIQEKVDVLCDGIKIQYIGWAKGEQSYEYFAAADLVVFPGRHSVYWEQVVAQGKPMICKYWDGTTHVDIGGNVSFLCEDSVESIENELNRLLNDDKAIYKEMLSKAQGERRENFLYSRIAKKSIEMD